MSYSTQNDFFNVPFRNEDPKLPDRKRSDGALMTYDLCTDSRAWALDKQKRSNYILDVVHKARFKKALLHPEGQFELTKDYLIHLDVEDLADYILRLQGEIKRKNDSVHQLEVNRKDLSEKLDNLQKQSDDFVEIQQQSAILEQERNEFEEQMEDLEAVIVSLKDRADRYDLLAKENKLLRCQLQKQSAEAADRLRLVNAEAEASFNRLRAEECEKLEAELILFKTRYEDLRQQKRELKEQLQKALVSQSKNGELKRQLALEQARREEIEDEMEQLLALYDQQFQGTRPEDHTLTEMQHLRTIAQPQEQRPVSKSSFRSTAEAGAETSFEVVVESCPNCKNVEAELANLKQAQKEELKQRDENAHLLKEQVETFRSKLDSVEASSAKLDTVASADDQLSKLTNELKKCQEELKVQLDKERSMQTQLEELQNNSVKLEAKLTEEIKKNEQMVAEINQAGPSAASAGPSTRPSAASAASTSSAVNDRVQELQKQLNEVNAELSEKQNRLEQVTKENTALQSTVSNFQEEIAKLEKSREQQSMELEASKTQLEASKTALEATKVALAQSKEQMTMLGGAELDGLRQANEELQKKVTLLESELAASQQMVQQLQEGSGEQTALLQTVSKLKGELQAAQDTVMARENQVRQLETTAEQLREQSQAQQLEVESMKARQVEVHKPEAVPEVTKAAAERAGSDSQVQKLESQVVESEATKAAEERAASDSQVQELESQVVASVQQLVDAEVVESLGQMPDLGVEESELLGQVPDLGVDEAESLRQLAAEESKKQLETSAEVKDGSVAAFQDDGIKQEHLSMEYGEAEESQGKMIPGEQKQLKEDEQKIEKDKKADSMQCVSTAEDGSEQGEIALQKKSLVSAEVGVEDKREGEIEQEDTATSDGEETLREEDGQGEGASAATQMDESKTDRDYFMDDGLMRIGYSDPDKTRKIAIKIVRHGISVLVIAELDHLHREITRAVIDRYLLLGQNFKTFDDSYLDSNQILEGFKFMTNNEMMAMISPSAQTPVHIPHLLEDDEIPVRIPAQSKPRPKSTSFSKYPMYAEPSMQLPGQKLAPRKSKERVLMGRIERFNEGSGTSPVLPRSKTHGRVLVDVDFGCRTRAWRANKMPAETIVASTLSDGSRLVARQKWTP